MNLEIILGGLVAALAGILYLTLALTIRSLRKEREQDRLYILDLQNRFMSKSYDEFRVWSPPITPETPPADVPVEEFKPEHMIDEFDAGRVIGEEKPFDVRD